MKTLELQLKKNLIILESKIISDLEKTLSYNGKSIQFICKGSDLTEEIASELVEFVNFNDKKFYTNYHPYESKDFRDVVENSFKSAKESFISAIEAKGFTWIYNSDEELKNDMYTYAWEKAEEKNLRNPIIFQIL